MTIKTSPTVTAHRNGFPKKAAPFPHLNPVLGGTPWVEEVTNILYSGNLQSISIKHGNVTGGSADLQIVRRSLAYICFHHSA
jgi:hypothetical protein